MVASLSALVKSPREIGFYKKKVAMVERNESRTRKVQAKNRPFDWLEYWGDLPLTKGLGRWHQSVYRQLGGSIKKKEEARTGVLTKSGANETRVLAENYIKKEEVIPKQKKQEGPRALYWKKTHGEKTHPQDTTKSSRLENCKMTSLTRSGGQGGEECNGIRKKKGEGRPSKLCTLQSKRFEKK